MTILNVVTSLAMAAALAAGANASAAPVFADNAVPGNAFTNASATSHDQATSASDSYYGTIAAGASVEITMANPSGNNEVLADVTAVPEPMTLALFLAGIVGIGLARIRHKS